MGGGKDHKHVIYTRNLVINHSRPKFPTVWRIFTSNIELMRIYTEIHYFYCYIHIIIIIEKPTQNTVNKVIEHNIIIVNIWY